MKFTAILIFSIIMLLESSYSQNMIVEFDITAPASVSDERRINIFILADGYLDNQDHRTRFNGQADRVIDELFGVGNSSPFDEYSQYFNVYKVFVPSQDQEFNHPCTGESCEDGVGCETVSGMNTAFDSEYDVSNVHRLMCADSDAVSSFYSAYVPNQNIVYTTIVLTNTSEWTGCANMDDEIATVTGWYGELSASFYEVAAAQGAVHEFGHTFAKLQDEYYYDNDLEAPNKDEAISPSTPNIWAHWNGINGISYHNHYSWTTPCNCDYGQVESEWWKPTSATNCNVATGCKMEGVNADFCSVCKEAIIERIHQLVNPIETFSPHDPVDPSESTPTIQAHSNTVFNLDLIEPTHLDMEVVWKLNGNVVATVTSPPWQWQMDCDNQYLMEEDPGTPETENVLTATVRDLADGKVRSHLHPTGHQFFDHDDHYWEQSWNITWNRETADLWMRDHDDDVGEEPWSPFGWFFDESPDIKVTQDGQGSTEFADILHENPDVSANPNYVYVQVHNRGCEASTAGEDLAVYTSIAGSGDSWPDNWDGTNSSLGYQVGTGSIPAIEGAASATVEVEWTVQDLVNGTPNWESCLLARIEDVTNDPLYGTVGVTSITDWV